MALIQVNFMSKSLMRAVPIQVILPVDKLFVDPNQENGFKPFKTLYLLHGIFGNYTDWVSATRVQRWAEEKNLAVVMPSGDNAFYLDQPASHNYYGEFIGNELVEVTRKMFHLSTKREDTFIGGLSMGGYGAIRNGLKYNQNFGCIAALSSALVLEDAFQKNDDFLSIEEAAFGKKEEAVLSDKNPRVLIEKIKEQMAVDGTISLPKIFMACGTQDIMIDVNRDLKNFFVENGIDLTYLEEAGQHNWDFWDKYIEKVIEWLPLDASSAGLNSGNVGV